MKEGGAPYAQGRDADTAAPRRAREPRRPLRLLLVTEAFHPVYSGAAVRFARYLPGFTERGIDASVYTATPSPVKSAMSGIDHDWAGRIGDLLPAERVGDVPVHRVRLPDHGSIRRGLSFNRGLVDLCRREPPDVVHMISFRFGAARTLSRLGRLGIATVFTATMMRPTPANPLKRRFERYRARRRFDGLDRAIVSSSVMRAEFERLGARTRIEVIPNGVDIGRFRPPSDPEERQRLRVRLGLPVHAILLLFAGPISPRKGVDLLARAWARFASSAPRAHLVLVGPRRDANDPAQRAFHDDVMNAIARSGAADRVHFPGLVGNVEEYMRAADAFVFTSRREGMPNVVPEAMATGLPVITTPFAGLPAEFGEPGRHFLLTDFDADRLAADLATLVEHPALRARFGLEARRWIASRMDVATSLDRHVALYRELASTASGRG